MGHEPDDGVGCRRSSLQSLKDARAEDDAFAVVISDVNMPEMDGIDFAGQIVERQLLTAEAVIMLTSGTRPEDISRLREFGVHRHLLKPAKQSELFDAIVGARRGLGLADPGAAAPTVDGSQDSRPLNVLLAEDNAVNQKLALGILGKLGHPVVVANDGQEALERINDSGPFDVVLMDVQMPEMDGLTATRELRKQERGTGRPPARDCNDRARDEGRPRTLPGCRYGRLFVQAHPHPGHC